MGPHKQRGQSLLGNSSFFCLTLFSFACGVAAVARAQASTEQPAQASPFTLTVDVNRVLIPVVVRDKSDRIISDLKQEDFQIFDDGKPRPIAGFQIESKGQSGGVSVQSAATSFATGAATAQPAPKTIYPRFIVLVFDDSHLSAEDLAMAKTSAATLLNGSLGESDYAAVLALSGRANSGITRDATKLQQALDSLRPNTVGRAISDCPRIDYYQAHKIVDQDDQEALQDVVSQLMSCAGMQRQNAVQLAPGYARSTLDQGESDIVNSLANLQNVVKALGRMNGQRLLILVSPGFFTGTATGLNAESKLIDSANQAAVTISALDARGLYVTALNASDNTQGRSPLEMAKLRSDSMLTSESVMADLADGTGGTFFRHNNDLSGGFQKLAETPDCIYLLELSLDGVKPNGSYHELKVKVDRDGTSVQARKGYAAPNGKKK